MTKEINSDEELEIEDTEEIVGEESLNDKIKTLRKKVKELEAEVKTNLDGWQRSRAELINKENSWKTEKIEIYKSATQNLVEDLIPVLDSYEMASKNKEVWEKVDKTWRVGVEYIFSQLTSVLENSGLKKVEVVPGTQFDINKMHAVEEVGTDDTNLDHTVFEMVQSGYELNGKLIREAKVKINIKK